MAYLSKSVPTTLGNLGIVNTTPANQLLAASATVTRWVRGISITANGTSGTWNFAVAAAAVLTAVNSIWFGQAIAAGATFTYVFPGKGLRLKATDDIMAFASVANMTLAVIYDELDLT